MNGMKGILLASLLLCGTAVMAQEGQTDFKKEYNRQVSHVGVSGLGVKSIIDRWQAAEPDNPEVYIARFQYCLDISKVDGNVIARSEKKYLGMDPVLALKDSLGNDVFYYQETLYDDAVFSDAMYALDQAIALKPEEMLYQFYKITSLLDFEKDSPDITADEILRLIDRYSANSGKYTYAGEPCPEEIFCQGVGEYCYRLFTIGSPASYSYFYTISNRMSKLYPGNTLFIDNIGSYWLVARNNSKKALQFYKKALKIDPTDQVARANIRIIELRQSQKGQSSK